MSLPRLPVTVISGYLGAGKTSLVNNLLRDPGGRRIMVMVNDFGELNIDADLLVSSDEDTLTLSNGCICCTMGTELIYALADALDRRPRPDCLVIEASGVAQPEKIAAAAKAEPDMIYGGIATLVDAANIQTLLADDLIGAQVRGQITVADLLLLTKADLGNAGAVRAAMAALTTADMLDAPFGKVSTELLLDRPEAEAPDAQHIHAHGDEYQSWSSRGGTVDRDTLASLINAPPEGLYRFKGRIALTDGTWTEVHLVGQSGSLIPCPPQEETRAVAIGLTGRFDPSAFQARWEAICRP